MSTIIFLFSSIFSNYPASFLLIFLFFCPFFYQFVLFQIFSSLLLHLFFFSFESIFGHFSEFFINFLPLLPRFDSFGQFFSSIFCYFFPLFLIYPLFCYIEEKNALKICHSSKCAAQRHRAPFFSPCESAHVHTKMRYGSFP